MQARTNQEWLQALRTEGPEQEGALKDLREGILRGLRICLAQRREGLSPLRPEGAEQLAEDCAQEALLAILKSLDTFRGESRFTTWAHQIALRLALGELRHKRWRDLSLDPARIGDDLPEWPLTDPAAPDPERRLQQAQVWQIIKRAIEEDLTRRQRSALVAHVFQGMPLDQVAAWLGTTRDAVYKLIHDARKKLKQGLLARRLTQEEILGIFTSRT